MSEHQKMKICKMSIQILKKHQKPYLGVVSDSPRTLWLLRSHLGNPILEKVQALTNHIYFYPISANENRESVHSPAYFHDILFWSCI